MVTLYKVGGCVRDEILGVRFKDIDYAVEAASYDVMRDYVASAGTIFLEKPEYLTIRAKFGKEDVDFVLCRKDGAYSDGRRPDTVTPGTIDDDLARRDFTINAIAKRMDGTYYDPHDGQGDLKRKLIRCVGRAQDRFAEDALRLLRAFRFAITKHCDLDSGINHCLHDKGYIETLDNVSLDRIRTELFKCFECNSLATIEKLYQFSYLRRKLFTIHGGALWLVPTTQERS
jgi:tRNA nucleotidyltransferase (CCA-adding enzyme)